METIILAAGFSTACDGLQPTRGIGQDKAMIVCSCNVFSDHQVRSVMVKQARPRRMIDVYACLKCNAKCGRCAPAIKRIMDEVPSSVHPRASMN
jgi:bacterioferritin-associated ferredoxin